MCVSENTVLKKNTENTEAFDVEVHDNQRVRGLHAPQPSIEENKRGERCYIEEIKN